MQENEIVWIDNGECYCFDSNLKAKDVYLVYLDGEKIGLIENKDELFNLIDTTQESIKKQFV